MTAQHQLAELIAGGGEDKHQELCADFVADHGPAIAELIESVASHVKDRCSWTEVLAALRKLTQDE